ncbi:biotin transporter BioY [Ruminococcus sp. Marseille-P6503]|uniref:biotin transporter BioY n=1 Tax=Ruminococcus sp. Marseille-P6503 TaxID=2364796 RepID=UPI000F524EF0|nr:biotin transporter BioY [Ruminococcus sp. Marseille-P6503]
MTSKKIRSITYCGLFIALIAVCSWISIPATVPFTLQTFGVFAAVGILGGKLGTIAVTGYVILGAIGVPVFAGFSGGMGAIAGTSGGYIIGFIFTALTMWLFEKLLGKKFWVLILSMVIGLIVCYAFGTVWFMIVYTNNTGAVGLGTVLGWCVTPFLIPDAVKIVCATIITNRVKKLQVVKL